MVFETLKVSREGAVLFVDIAAQPMNLLGPERGGPMLSGHTSHQVGRRRYLVHADA
jgi:murein endopeptidase